MHVNIGDVYWDKQKPELPTCRCEKAVISQLYDPIGNWFQLFFLGAVLSFK